MRTCLSSLWFSRLLALGALVLGALAGADAFAQGAIRVQTHEVRAAELIREVPLTGTVSSPRHAVLSTEVEGLISAVHVDEGDPVATGDILVELDPELSRIALDAAEAAVAQRRETVADLRRQVEEARTLAANNNFPASELRGLESQLRVGEAEQRAAQAELRRAQAELERHWIRAPFNGTVSRKLADLGEWMSPGAELVELLATDQLRLDFQVPQRFYPQVDESTPLQVRFEAYPEQTYSARVDRKVPLSNSEARTFLLRALLGANPNPLLIPGMSADALLQLSLRRQGLTVPRDALLRYPDGRVSVWVVTDVNRRTGRATAREQRVAPGLGFGNQVEITRGLEPGHEVIVRGNEALREGQPVQIVNDSSE
ncbi:efflux RND transporter periplasmic adaptor subunit [Gilvimarinus sp. F26214L]|uniref:efflux RND transporter periplasmic adaptor subunit n=1 Tax=Gilvimarinus sp. DZF01 TaxID=3461371 RepID=UPI004045F792